MNAGPSLFIELIANAAYRYVIPVYQRPYSWDEEHCEQLWDDILAIAQRPGGTHFTGSVVSVQQGTFTLSGTTPVLIIDGQQRITTLSLLLIALARYAREHPEAQLAYSYDEIIGRGFLVDRYKAGDDHYRLTLSQGDRETLRSLVDNLEDPTLTVRQDSPRLVNNLRFFERRLEQLSDPSEVWRGIQRLQIVSITLDQGRDNPQLIFESMNSTGKGLSSADLIRNFVLMSQSLHDQEALYKNHWRKIEEALGPDSYDSVFDNFVRNWLTVLYAPEPLTKREVYPLFKRHVFDNGYDRDGRIRELLQEMERFAGYYAKIEGGECGDAALAARLASLAKLEVTAANPLLLSFFDDYESGAFGVEALYALLDTLESYLLRRAACNCASTGLNKFFPSVIARLNKVQEEGGDYLEAFQAMLLNEAGTARRFPSDAEFAEQLAARDLYHSRRCLYLLSKLENSYYPKAPRDFGDGTFTIEHIMPQNALASEEWRAMLGEGCEEVHDRLLHTLGNLTITAFNSELSDASFEQKKARAVGGFDVTYIHISSALKGTDTWGEPEITERGRALAQRAVEVWPLPQLSEERCLVYAVEKRGSSKQLTVKFRDLFQAGIVEAGEVLTSTSHGFPGTAEVTGEGRIRIFNGEEFDSPSLAAVRHVALKGGAGARNGWHFWRVGEKLLDSRRRAYIGQKYGSDVGEVKRFRLTYWDGFYEYCSNRPDIVALFSDLSAREPNGESWASFGIGLGSYRPHLNVWKTEDLVNATIWCDSLESYQRLLAHRDEIEAMEHPDDTPLAWDPVDKDTKSRTVVISRKADLEADDLEELYCWQADWLKWMRAVLLRFVG